MNTATLYVTNGYGASITIDAPDVLPLPVFQDDGPGPIPAAVAVLERHGWRPAGAWVQDAGGISGDVWTVPVERVAEEPQRYLGPCGRRWVEWNPDGTPLDAGYCEGDVYAGDTAAVGRCRTCGAEEAR